jgi:hypothetical protein
METFVRDFQASHVLEIGGRRVSDGPGQLHLDDAFLSVQAARSNRIGYEQMEVVEATPGGLSVTLHPEGSLRIGPIDGAFARPLYVNLCRLRGLRWATLLRLMEGDPVDELESKMVISGQSQVQGWSRLYSHSLVAMPYGGEPVQVPLAELSDARLVDYRLRCEVPSTSLELYGSDPPDLARFHRAIMAARQRVDDETESLLMKAFPALELADRVELTRLLARGHAARKRDLDSRVPWLWDRVEELLGQTATKDYYAYLKSQAGADLWFGIRTPLGSDSAGGGEPQDLSSSSATTKEGAPAMTGPAPSAQPTDTETSPPSDSEAAGAAPLDYLLWFMAAVGSPGKRGLAVEVISGKKGFATYVYRCQEAADEAASLDATAQTVSEAMVGLNFYREPLYAPQKEIDYGRFADYKLAIRKLPYLRAARSLLVGRAVHSTLDSWKAQVSQLVATAGQRPSGS